MAEEPHAGIVRDIPMRRNRRIRIFGGACAFAAATAAPAAASPLECRELAVHYAANRQALVERQVNTLLAQAAQKGCLDLAAALIGDGASVHARRRGGETVLHFAVKLADPAVAALFIGRGADIELRTLAGATPLMLAVEANRPRMVAMLLDRGADPNAPGRSAVSPLAAAAFTGNERVVDLLLGRGADPSAEDSTGKTAIAYAAARGFTRIVERLLGAGVDVHRRYGNALTVLMWAAGHANDVPEADGLRTVELLLGRGARLDDADNRGRTALMIAAELGHGAIVTLLLACGADPGHRDGDGKTAFDIANASVRALLESPPTGNNPPKKCSSG
jgi:uncharacterized protein